MSRGRRYNNEAKLNLKKVFAVIVAFIVIIMAIIILKNILTKAKNTKPVEAINYFALYQDEKWGILGSNGEIIVQPMYQEMPIIIDCSKDVFLCTYDVNEEDGTYKTKVINKENEEIFTEYEKVEAIENYDESENVWYEENILKVEKNGKWGLIDLTGKELATTEYEKIQALKGIKNSILIEKDGKYGLLNSKGVKVLDTNYSQILNFGDEYKNGYITVDEDGKYGISSFSGDKILENQYEKIEKIYSDKYFVVEKNGKKELINKDGNTVLTQNANNIKQIANSGVVFTQNNKYGLMNFEGEVLIQPTYSNLKEINTDVFLAEKEGKSGVVDNQNNEKIAFNYKDITYNKKANLYIAENENYESSILDSGFAVKITGILSEINTEDGYMKIKVGNDYKYYNFKFQEKSNKEVLIANKIFLSKKDGKYGFEDSKGNTIIEHIYDDATETNKYGYAAVKKDGLWGAVDKTGTVVIEPQYNLDENLVIDFIGKWHLGLDLNMNYYCDK